MATKVIYNACYGGFGLSDAAIKRYAQIKGLTLYPEKDERFSLTTYWLIPAEERTAVLEGDAWFKASLEDRIASNRFYDANTLRESIDFDRTDPVLVQVIEELGPIANGTHADLMIETVAVGQHWRIREYDGYENVELRDEIEWNVAT